MPPPDQRLVSPLQGWGIIAFVILGLRSSDSLHPRLSPFGPSALLTSRPLRTGVQKWDSVFTESGQFSAKTRSNRIQSRSSGTQSGSSAAQSSSGAVPSRSGGAICPSRGTKSGSNVIPSRFLRHSTGLRRPPMAGGWGWAAPSLLITTAPSAAPPD